MKKRRPFLLLEMMIAFLIMTGIMALLFTGFYTAIKARNNVRKEKERILNLQRLKLRFAILFENIIDVKDASNQTYYIRYQGKIDSNPNFRSEVEAILRIKNNILTLTCWPKKGDPRSEVLSTNAEMLKFEFFDEKKGDFDAHYPSKKPLMMKIIIDQEILPLFL